MDRLDNQLLRALRVDGRTSTRSLARLLGVPEVRIRARLERLLGPESVRIVGYVHPIAAGMAGTVHASLRVSGSATAVAHAVARSSAAQFVSVTAGAFPVVSEIRVREHEDAKAVMRWLRSVPGVVDVAALVQLDVFRDMFVPIQVPTVTDLDSTDWTILEALQSDGRIPYEQLGRLAGVSTGTARNRVRRLVSGGVLHIGAETQSGTAFSEQATGVGVIVRESADAVVDFLGAHPAVTYAATCVGRFDLVATVAADDPQERLRFLDDLRMLPGVEEVQSWVHLDVVKQSYTVRPPAALISPH